MRLVLALSSLLACASALAYTPTPESTARLLPIAGDGYADSSANVIAGLQNSLCTEGRLQFTAFYRADGAVVIGKRTIGQDHWETTVTALRGDPADAHRTVALAIDGQGYLHLAWNHHNHPLQYVRSHTPFGVDFGAPQTMVGRAEESVTYPAFVRLTSGDLLFHYRSGKSGRGDLVLNRYDASKKTWRRVHDSLISGEGARSAYPSLTADAQGRLHLAWVWRSTPDVATNQDLAYARSLDGGETWQTVRGTSLALPLTAATADYAWRIPAGQSLMNPPAVTGDKNGRPLIVNYWAATGSDIPQLRLVRFNGEAWEMEEITQRKTPFVLQGTQTKRPPLSRAIVVSRDAWNLPSGAAVVYRDDEQGGRAMLAFVSDLSQRPWAWKRVALTEEGLGAWEPSYDTEQWQRLGQLHLLIQKVEQKDGQDHVATQGQPTAVSSLIWSPFIFGHAENRAGHKSAALPTAPAGYLEKAIDPQATLATLKNATAWQLAFDYKRDPRGWEIAPFYIGALEVAKVSQAADLEKELQVRFEKMAWAPAPRDYHADDYCVTQAYAELYRKTGDKRMLEPSLALFQRLLAKPSQAKLDWNSPHCLDRWSWCDALFMAPASWLDAYWATGDRAHVEFTNREWWLTTDTLYIPADGFYARDESYLDLREPNGRRLYWSRGNGWVAAGLARTLARFPKDHADQPRYEALYLRMMEAVLAAQQPDGLWRPGLLDAEAHPAREVSGTSFYTFALAWGINHGYLPKERFEPAVRRAWNALLLSVRENGKLENVQPIGAAPEGFDPTHTDAFGVGAFLLAGAETYRLVTGTPEPLLAR